MIKKTVLILNAHAVFKGGCCQTLHVFWFTHWQNVFLKMVLKTTILKTFNVCRKLLVMEFTVKGVTVCYGLLSSSYLGILDNLQELICSTVGPSIATSLEPLAYCRNVASLSFFYWNYSGRRSSELDELVSLPYSPVWSTRYCKNSLFYYHHFYML